MTDLKEVFNNLSPSLDVWARRPDFYVERDPELMSHLQKSLATAPAAAKAVLMGHRGVGKSTALQWLAKQPSLPLHYEYQNLETILNLSSVQPSDVLLFIIFWLLDLVPNRKTYRISNQTTSLIESLPVPPESTHLLALGLCSDERRNMLKTKLSSLPDLHDDISALVTALQDVRGQPIVLLLDGFDKLDHRDVETLLDTSVMKLPVKLLVSTSISIAYLFTPEQRLKHFCNGDRCVLTPYPILNLKGEYQKGALEQLEALVLKRVTAASFGPTALDLALQLSGGIPRQLSRLLHDAALNAAHQKRARVLLVDVTDAAKGLRAELFALKQGSPQISASLKGAEGSPGAAAWAQDWLHPLLEIEYRIQDQVFTQPNPLLKKKEG